MTLTLTLHCIVVVTRQPPRLAVKNPPLTLRCGMPQAMPPDAGEPNVVPTGHVELEGVEESPGHVV